MFLIFLKRILSHFIDFKTASFPSDLNNILEVWYSNGKLVLHSANANYSFGSLHFIFQDAFKISNFKNNPPSNLLLLGFGAGSIVKIIREEFNLNFPITAIEYDKIIIEIGKQYFNTSAYKNLKIINEDAYQFTFTQVEPYSCIVIDLFNDTEVPEQFVDILFLNRINKILLPGGILFFNIMVSTPVQIKKMNTLLQIFKTFSGSLEIVEPIGTNKVLIWRKVK